MSTRQKQSPPAFLKLLAHELRWQLITALAESDLRVGELVAITGEPPNLVSYHLKQLRQAELVSERRSIADGRDIYYTLDIERLRALYLEAGRQIHPALVDLQDAPPEPAPVPLPPVRVLFLCTHNSARSQMAEALTRHLGGDSVEVFSAGNEPSQVHPFAIEVLGKMGLDISDQQSTDISLFLDQDFDHIITVCDRARESCPVFPGDPHQIHWSFPDPVEVEDEEERLEAFNQIARQLALRINYLLIMIDRERQRAAAG